jgi:ATP-binding cassette subfamily B protein
LENYLREYLGHRVGYDIRNALYNHWQGLSFAYHDRQMTGDLMARATADVENIRNFIAFGLIRAGYMIVIIVAIAFLLFSMNTKLALLCLAFIPFITIRASILGVRLRAIWTRANEITGELGNVLQESMTGIRVVKAFSRQKYETEKFSAKADALAKENLMAVQVEASNGPLMNLVFAAMLAVVLWFGAREIIAGRLTEGELTQFLFFVAMLEQPVRMSGFIIGRFARAVSSGHRIFEVLDARSPVQEKPAAKTLKDVRGEVSFEGVAFWYADGQPVLQDISFRAPAHKVVALLGATGSGKSTVVHLLPRFYDVSGGRILIDGQDIRDVTLRSLRRTVGIVQQDVFLFSATIRDNVAYGTVEATQEQVEWACKIARLHDFITSLPQGYDTWVGERGITLSGGQKQRLAIARTLLLDPAVLVLDDSTSSVDTETEHLIREAIAELIKGRTTFVIAQRLSTVKAADMILVLERGRIVQRGTHEDLLKEDKGLYRSIYELQLRPQEEAWQAVGHLNGEAAVGRRSHTGEALPEVRRG